MFYYSSFWGMNMIWWFVWIILMFWIFATPYNIPGQRKKKDGPLDILQRRFALGEITNEEYQEKKKTIEHDLSRFSNQFKVK
jgi:putative membrane protein